MQSANGGLPGGGAVVKTVAQAVVKSHQVMGGGPMEPGWYDEDGELQTAMTPVAVAELVAWLSPNCCLISFQARHLVFCMRPKQILQAD